MWFLLPYGEKKVFIIWHGLRQGNDRAVYTLDKKTPVQRVSVHGVREKHTCNSAKTFPKLLKLFCVTLDSGATRVSRIVPTQLK